MATAKSPFQTSDWSGMALKVDQIIDKNGVAVNTTDVTAAVSGSGNLTETTLTLNGATSGSTVVGAAATASGTLTLPAATDTLTGKATTDVFTNKTLDTAGAGNVLKVNGTQVSAVTGTGSVVLATTPTLVTPVLGVATATSVNKVVLTAPTTAATLAFGTDNTTQTFQGTDTIVGRATTDTLTNKTITGSINTDVKRCSGSVTANGTVTYANVTGLSHTVVPGTYKFELELPSTVASGTGGIKYAFNYTTTVVSALEASGIGMTASAVAVQHTTTTTTQADLFTQAAVVIYTRIVGTMVVGTGGTVDVQMAQNTSNASNSVALLGASSQFTRIA